MGLEDNKAQEKRDKRKAKSRQPAPWASDGIETEEVYWRDVDPLLVAYVTQAVCDAGASVQFTRSRDGGALGVRVYDTDIRVKTEWGRPLEDIEDVMYRIADYYRQVVGEEALRW